MIPTGADSAANRIGESLRGTDIVEQTGGKSPAKRFVEYRGRKIIGVPAGNAGSHHENVALIHIGLVDFVKTRLRRIRLDLRVIRRWSLGPRSESVAQPSLHLRRIKVADHTENNIVRVRIPSVPVDQILTCDSGDRGVFGDARVGAVCSIDELRRLTARDL